MDLVFFPINHDIVQEDILGVMRAGRSFPKEADQPPCQILPTTGEPNA
ncbi:hypothetical protein [Roseibium suaedae]|nr:hypothetical protein [Roseibium suaedae]